MYADALWHCLFSPGPAKPGCLARWALLYVNQASHARNSKRAGA